MVEGDQSSGLRKANSLTSQWFWPSTGLFRKRSTRKRRPKHEAPKSRKRSTQNSKPLYVVDLNCIWFIIVLDSCCISKSLSSQFIKDRPVSSLGVFIFEFLRSRFRVFGCFVFEIRVLRFRVLCFRVLGASFSRFGCFVLLSLFSSASFSKLPPLLALINSPVSDFFFHP